MYQCTICPSSFKTEKGLNNHKCRWICKICGKKLTTIGGYNRHVENHANSEKLKRENQQKHIQEEERRNDEFQKKYQKLKDLGLFNPSHKQGDSVIVSTYAVTKPTHEWRFNRNVRVRYEEERIYFVETMTIDKVIEPTVNDLYRICRCIEVNKEYTISYLSTNRRLINQSNIFADLESATQHCDNERKKYKEACDFASMCR